MNKANQDIQTEDEKPKKLVRGNSGKLLKTGIVNVIMVFGC